MAAATLAAELDAATTALEAAGLTNLRLLRGDAVELLQAVLVPHSLAGIRMSRSGITSIAP